MEFELDIEICLTQASSKTISVKPSKGEVNMSNTPIKVKTPYSRMKDQRTKNTGIQVTIVNTFYPKKHPTAKIINLQALPREKLPRTYLKSPSPRVWQYKDKLFAGNGYVLLEIGSFYSREKIIEPLRYIQLAGEHLAMVNRDFDWSSWITATFKDGKLLK